MRCWLFPRAFWVPVTYCLHRAGHVVWFSERVLGPKQASRAAPKFPAPAHARHPALCCRALSLSCRPLPSFPTLPPNPIFRLVLSFFPQHQPTTKPHFINVFFESFAVSFSTALSCQPSDSSPTGEFAPAARFVLDTVFGAPLVALLSSWRMQLLAAFPSSPSGSRSLIISTKISQLLPNTPAIPPYCPFNIAGRPGRAACAPP